MSKEMKMSDVFDGELIHYESGNRSFYGDIGMVTEQGDNYKNALAIASYKFKYDYAVAICHAVNNHDTLTEQVRQLRELVKSAYIEGCHDGYSEGLSDGQSWSSTKTRKELAAEGVEYMGQKYQLNFEIAPKLGINDGIEIVRQCLKDCVFDETGTEQGVKCLENYRKEWNDKLGCWRDNPLHDWSSHGADGFRYLAVVESGTRPQVKRPTTSYGW